MFSFKSISWTKKDLLTLSLIVLSFIYMIFYFPTLNEFWEGLLLILKSESVLVTDYIALGGISAALFNAVFSMIFVWIMVLILNKKTSAINFAAIWIVFGFGLFGKNIINMWPVILGVYLYSLSTKQSMKTLITVAIFSTAAGPISSWFWFEFSGNLISRLALGVGLGVIVGFATAMVSSTFKKMHQGLTLYNIGLSVSFVLMIIYMILKLFGLEISAGNGVVSNQYTNSWLLFFALLATIAFIISIRKNIIKDYFYMLKNVDTSTNPAFEESVKEDIVIFNFAILTIFSTLIVYLMGNNFGAISVGGIITLIGFGMYGKQIHGVIFVSIGVIGALFINYHFNGIDYSSDVAMSRILFGSSLAPIAYAMGPLFAIIAGFIHVAVANNILDIHRFSLYHNGFSAGFIAILFISYKTNFIGIKKNRD